MLESADTTFESKPQPSKLLEFVLSKFKGEFLFWSWQCDLFWLACSTFAFDKVFADLSASFVSFDHTELFAHVEGDVIFLAWASVGAFGDDEVVFILNEAIFVDAVFDPSRIIFANV